MQNMADQQNAQALPFSIARALTAASWHERTLMLQRLQLGDIFAAMLSLYCERKWTQQLHPAAWTSFEAALAELHSRAQRVQMAAARNADAETYEAITKVRKNVPKANDLLASNAVLYGLRVFVEALSRVQDHFWHQGHFKVADPRIGLEYDAAVGALRRTIGIHRPTPAVQPQLGNFTQAQQRQAEIFDLSQEDTHAAGEEQRRADSVDLTAGEEQRQTETIDLTQKDTYDPGGSRTSETAQKEQEEKARRKQKLEARRRKREEKRAEEAWRNVREGKIPER